METYGRSLTGKKIVQSTDQKRLPCIVKNHALFSNPSGFTREKRYFFRKKPHFWGNCLDVLLPLTILFGTILQIRFWSRVYSGTAPLRRTLLPMATQTALKPHRTRPDRLISDAKRQRAVRLFELGYGYKRVACEIGVSPNTTRDWARLWKQGKFKVRASKSLYEYTEEFKQYVIGLRLSGMSWVDLKAETGVCAATCRRWISYYQTQGASALDLLESEAAATASSSSDALGADKPSKS